MASTSSHFPTIPASMQEFKLYETQSNFYMIGWDQNNVHRVLKIDRLDPSELNIREDSTTYTKKECSELLKRIHEGNRATGGLKFVTSCYGIVGFIKFLGPYYMLLITERRHIGVICGHNVYAVSKSEMVPLPNSSMQCHIANPRHENRYKKLLFMVDLTRDFFFSYSYHVMRTLQKNLCDNETGKVLYETIFVWNEFLTRKIRNHLQNTLWTVALVYGFFKQATLSASGRKLTFTLIARRSRHNAGTRYLKRGVDDNGNVANDVETEQILSEDVPEGSPLKMSSVVQNRGSIPLLWSQETSWLNLKPNIVLSKKDPNYEATRRHFENIAERYGNPIIILNLIKAQEKKPRESILRSEFANAIDFINKDLPEESCLRFLHWDLHKHFHSKAANVLVVLGKVAACALVLTGFFSCQIILNQGPEGVTSWPPSKNVDPDNNMEKHFGRCNSLFDENCFINPVRFQTGVLRTNCIDCLDRTNVAQYAYGWASFGEQLHALGVRSSPEIDLDDSLAVVLMGFYEKMGDTLAHQYGGSAAHNKVFCERRGQWRAAIQSQEFLRTLQRYYNNAYMDAEKQDAIDVFLGNFLPQHGEPAVWELRSNTFCNGRNGAMNGNENERSFMKRCLSDGNILDESGSQMSAINAKQESPFDKVLSDRSRTVTRILSESSPDISSPAYDIALSRCSPSLSQGRIPGDIQTGHCDESNHIYASDQGDSSNFSNFIDVHELSFSENSCEEPFDRSSVVTNSSTAGLSVGNIVGEVPEESTPSTSETASRSLKGHVDTDTELSYGNVQSGSICEEFPDSIKWWVAFGEALCH